MIIYNIESKYAEFILITCSTQKRCDISKLFTNLNEDLLLEICKQNEVASIVGFYLLNNLDNSSISPKWKYEVDKIAHTTGEYIKELNRLSELFHSSGIKLVALKNSGIVSNILPIPCLFPMGDLDTLVSRSKFREAHELLIKNGYKIKSPNKFKIAKFEEGFINGSNEYEYFLSKDFKLWFELLWRPVDGKFISHSQEISGELIIKNAIKNKSTYTYIPSNEHNLLQVCIHTAKHSYIRSPGFRLHLDVHRIVSNCEINWDIFLSLINQYRVRTITFFSLAIPFQIFNTNIPIYVMDSIKPTYIKRAVIFKFINIGGLFNPKDKKFNLLGFLIFTVLLHDNLSTIVEVLFKKNGERRPFFKNLFNTFKRLYKLIFEHTLK